MDTDCLKFCFLDTETNGLSPKTNNIIEIGWVITDKYLNVLKQENLLINGDFEISEFIKNLTGITKERTISDGVALKVAFEKLYNDINQCTFIVAHNIMFDYKMILGEINNLFKNNRNEMEHYEKIFKSKIRLCSMHILKKECIDRGLVVTNHKLQTLHNYLVETSQIQSHRAIADVYMILECFQILDDFDILKYFWEKSVVFGKHKGKTNEWIYENDKDYFNWLLANIYNVNTLYKKEQLLYQDEEYEEDGFIVNNDTIEYMDTEVEEEEEEEVEHSNIPTPPNTPVPSIQPNTQDYVDEENDDSDADDDYEEESSESEESSEDESIITSQVDISEYSDKKQRLS